jgi:hypothetical protein
MRKIKDLSSVILDNAVSFFPVDSERYELAASVRLNAAYYMQHLGVYQHETWRINEWLQSTDATVWRAVEAFIRVSNEEKEISVMEQDLARRFQAMFEGNTLLQIRMLSLDDEDLLKADLYGSAWRVISAAMRHSTLFNPGTSGSPLFRNGQGGICGIPG